MKEVNKIVYETKDGKIYSDHYDAYIHEKPLKYIYADLDFKENPVHEVLLEFENYPTELLDKISNIGSRLQDTRSILKLSDDETCGLEINFGKEGFKKLEKIISHLIEIEDIIK